MKRKTGAPLILVLLLIATAGLAGCLAPGAHDQLWFSATSRTTPGASSFKTYFIQGSGRADLTTIDGQALKSRVTTALAAKGLVEASNPRGADMVILLFADIQMTKTPITYSTPNTVYIPGTTSVSTTTSQQYPGGMLVPSTTVTTTQGRTINAGTTQHTIDKYGISGLVTMTAYDLKAWLRSGAPKGTSMRVIWQTEVSFNGDPPLTFVNLIDKAFDWILYHAAEEARFAKVFTPPAQIGSFPIP